MHELNMLVSRSSDPSSDLPNLPLPSPQTNERGMPAVSYELAG
jgi:hypothetical protein